jgi:hypothetical protein
MIGRSCRIVIALLFGVSLVGCGAGSQSGLNPSGGAQAIARPQRSSSVHKAALGFTWTHNTVDLQAGQTLYESTACPKGAIVINGAYKKKHIGNDITVIDSFPVSNYEWQITAKNNGDHQESFVAYLLCAAGS